MSSTADLQQLLAKVTDLTNELSATLKEANHPPITFAADCPEGYKGLSPQNYVKRQVLADLLQDMVWLVQGPVESVTAIAHSNITDAVCLDVLNHFSIWDAIPLDGDRSYAEIAEAVKLPEEAIRRIFEHAVTIRLFEKVDPTSMKSRIRHNSRSAVVLKSAGLRSLISTSLNNAGPSLTVLPHALEKYSRGKTEFTKDMNNTAFSLLYSGGKLGDYNDMWDFIEKDGEGETKGQGWRQGDMVASMRWIKESLNLDELMLKLTDWKGAGKAHVVDIGGSAGHDDVVLAKTFPDLTINVQDLPKCEPDFEKTIPDELKGQITFRAHDFFKDQPVQADIYLLKFIFYDWPKEQAVKIIQAMRPALRPGTKIVIMEFVGSPPAEGTVIPRSMRKTVTSTDVRMMALFGHSERTVQDVKDLFIAADERFEIQRVDPDTKPPVVMLEIEWKG